MLMLLLVWCALAIAFAQDEQCGDFCSLTCNEPACDDFNDCTIDLAIGAQDYASKACEYLYAPPNTPCLINISGIDISLGVCLRGECINTETDPQNCGALEVKCPPRNTCVFNTCVPPRANGELCHENNECASYNCFAGACRAKRPGAPCALGTDCLSGTCTEDACEFSDCLEPCLDDSDCRVASTITYCRSNTANGPSVCRRASTNGFVETINTTTTHAEGVQCPSKCANGTYDETLTVNIFQALLFQFNKNQISNIFDVLEQTEQPCYSYTLSTVLKSEATIQNPSFLMFSNQAEFNCQIDISEPFEMMKPAQTCRASTNSSIPDGKCVAVDFTYTACTESIPSVDYIAVDNRPNDLRILSSPVVKFFPTLSECENTISIL